MDEAALVEDVFPDDDDGLETLDPVEEPCLRVTAALLRVLPTLMPPRIVPPAVLTVLLDEELPVATTLLLSVWALRPW